MPKKRPVDRVFLSLLTRAVAHSGVGLAKVRPIRKAMVRVVQARLISGIEDSSSEYPLGVREDRAAMGLALLHTVNRGLERNDLAPAVLRYVTRHLAENVLQDPGDRKAVDRFRAQYGTNPPGFLTISPGKACNLHCTGCWADADTAGDKLEWSVFDRIVSDAKTLWGSRAFVITGGEPLAYRSQRKGLLDIAQKHDDCFFMFYTNGTLISQDVAERLAQLGNLSPAISLEGFRQRTDDRRGAGVFDKVEKAMDRLRQAGVPFGIALTATRHNAEEILSDEFIDFCFERHGALYGWIFHYMPIGRSYTIDLMPTPQQRIWMWQRVWEIIRERRIFLADFWNHATCCDGCLSAGRHTGGGYMYVDWNGALTPCVFVPYSPVNLRDAFERGRTLNDAWDEGFFADIRAWQSDYSEGNSRPGNWLAPCIIRDHHDDFRIILNKHEPEPIDPNAAEAWADPEYVAGMRTYDEAYQALADEIWEQQYLREDGAGTQSAQRRKRRQGAKAQ